MNAIHPVPDLPGDSNQAAIITTNNQAELSAVDRDRLRELHILLSEGLADMVEGRSRDADEVFNDMEMKLRRENASAHS